ncbi:hypothetical protein RMSM_02860 [Rhodopirellula maiorica SM1]|uniref:Uncharacterized protein n=1 Tax=Rhodopirellula maiorica SM1 TaxID=1265738 RepID=M5RLX3_9BACT|nr:hypothetical protein RMSM_02860 [Rhodopirellula maiorica SM1]
MAVRSTSDDRFSCLCVCDNDDATNTHDLHDYHCHHHYPMQSVALKASFRNTPHLGL